MPTLWWIPPVENDTRRAPFMAPAHRAFVLGSPKDRNETVTRFDAAAAQHPTRSYTVREYSVLSDARVQMALLYILKSLN